MAIKAKKVTATNKDGESVNLAGNNSGFGNSHAFTIIPADYVTAIIEKVDESRFQMMVTGYPNPDTEDGKWTHVRLTPKFKLLNDNASIISKQSFIVGAVVKDEAGNEELVAPNPDNDIVWGGMRGARDFLQSLKLFTEDGEGGFNLTLHAPAIRGLAVRVSTSVGGYKKGSFDIPPIQMLALLNEHSEEVLDFGKERFDMDAINKALEALNEAEGLTEETGYKLKNVITKIQPVWSKKAAEEGLYVAVRDVEGTEVQTGQIFANEDAFEAYTNAMYDADLVEGF
jgi:hypothetical protein